MKKIVALLLIATTGFVLIACNAMNTVSPQVNENSALFSAPEEVLSETKETDTAIDFSGAEISIILTVGDHNFHAALLNTQTTAELIDLLPLTLDMSDLNGNEKYFYLDSSLPTDPSQPGQINAGDLMLYGDNCLVLFYESFSSSYSYTRLGSLDDPARLAETLGADNADVTFSIGANR